MTRGSRLPATAGSPLVPLPPSPPSSKGGGVRIPPSLRGRGRGGGSDARYRRKSRNLRGLWDNRCFTGLFAPFGFGGLVNFYCAMNDLEDYDRRSHPQHYGLANSEGQIYRSAELIAWLNQVEDLDYGTPGVAPEPPLTS